MGNQQHLELLEQSVPAWNQWRRQHPDLRPDLSDANLSSADFREANLSQADLSEAYLHGADLNCNHG